MKIADSAPPALRINPHIITDVRSDMVKQKRIIAVDKLWYHRATEDPARVEARLIQLRSIYKKITKKDFVMRVGQTLEIAILRALEQSGIEFVGGFTDLEDHDDSTLYKKEEPPLRFSGHRMPGEKRFDFLAFYPTAGRVGIEAKNIREWIYPRRPEIKEVISKSLVADAIPVLIGRRIPYVTFRLFSRAE